MCRTDAVAIVTGGSSGPGRAVARALGARGYAVVVVYGRDQRGAEAAVEEILAANGTAIAVRADVADELDVERLFTETAAAFGRVDVVVHTVVGAGSELARWAARRIGSGGVLVDISGARVGTAVVAGRARGLTAAGRATGRAAAVGDRDIADLVEILDPRGCGRGE